MDKITSQHTFLILSECPVSIGNKVCEECFTLSLRWPSLFGTCCASDEPGCQIEHLMAFWYSWYIMVHLLLMGERAQLRAQ